MSPQNDWEFFCERAATVMRNVLERKIALKEASDFFDNDPTIKNQDLRRYVESMVWEVDGNREYFLEILSMFASHTPEEAFVEYLSS